MNRLSLKRIYKEIDDFKNQKNFENYSYPIINFFNNLELKLYTILDNNIESYHIEIKKENNEILLDLIIPKDYPFRNYNIFKYNLKKNKNKNFNKYLADLSNKKNIIYDKNILKFFYKIQYINEPKFLNLYNNDCYCCSTIVCLGNWSPALKLNDILLEYIELKFIIKYNEPYNYLKILYIYNSLYELFFSQLPDEIIELIMSYIV